MAKRYQALYVTPGFCDGFWDNEADRYLENQEIEDLLNEANLKSKLKIVPNTEQAFRMSIYEIAEAFAYYKKTIRELREQNKKLKTILEDTLGVSDVEIQEELERIG